MRISSGIWGSSWGVPAGFSRWVFELSLTFPRSQPQIRARPSRGCPRGRRRRRNPAASNSRRRSAATRARRSSRCCPSRSTASSDKGWREGSGPGSRECRAGTPKPHPAAPRSFSQETERVRGVWGWFSLKKVEFRDKSCWAGSGGEEQGFHRVS